MEHTMKRSIRIVSLLAVLSLFVFAAVAYADDDTVPVPTIADGRINAHDVAAPVAIFAYYDYPYADDINLGVLDHLEFWGFTGSDSIEKMMNVTANDIASAEVTDGTSVLIASANGYGLYKEADGSLTLSAPAYGYQFNWVQS
jgi:hypothetical protein